MSSRIRAYIRQHHVGLVALFLVLSGGTAYALDGSNTVFTDDIVDDEIRTQDIRTGHVTNPDLGGSSVTTGKIADGAVRSPDVLDNNLTGADINESSLGQVPSAALGGIGRWEAGVAPSLPPICDPGSDFYATCDFVSMDLSSPSKVFMTAALNAYPAPGADDVHGNCRLATHLGPISGSTVPVIVTNRSLLNGAGEVVALTAMTGVLAPGAYDFAVQCNQLEADIEYDHIQLSAVALSPN